MGHLGADNGGEMTSIEFRINPMEIPAIAIQIAQIQHIVGEYALRYVTHGQYHQSLREAADQAALDMKGLSSPHEIKRLFRREVKRLLDSHSY